jgi:hypothetical protein
MQKDEAKKRHVLFAYKFAAMQREKNGELK